MKQEKQGKKTGKMYAGGKAEKKAGDQKEKVNNSPEQDSGTIQHDPDEKMQEEYDKTGREETDETLQEEEAEIILEEKLKETEIKYLRLAAEFDNYRKRTLREKAELTKLAGEEIIGGLLPVIDDFDRAVESMNSAKDIEAMKKGVDLINTKFREFLRQKGVKEIQAIGKEFDTDLHEAVTKIPVSAKKDKGRIVDVIEKGYILHDKVIRYAKVVVGE